MDALQRQDIDNARKRTRIDIDSIRSILWQAGRRQAIDNLVKLMSKEPVFDKDVRRHMSRQEAVEQGYRIQLRLIELRRQYQWDHETFMLAMTIVDDHVPFGLHYSAFMPVVESQGSDEQIAEWLPKCQSLEVLGAYAQTELGHGSNVQALETTATFDKTDNTFVMHSPTLTSSKWWIGGLGTVANHAVVQAQLVLPNQNVGPHLFIVPLREQTTHRPLPGIQMGDIGPKVYSGFHMNDNGYLRMRSVKIPAKNLLCRYAKVDDRGKYTPASHSRIQYGSMVALRAGMATTLGLELAKCVTISIRYTTVRRQFSAALPKTSDKVEDNVANGAESGKDEASHRSDERQVITYSSVKARLIPLLALSYAYILTGHATMAMYQKMLSALVKPPHDTAMLAEVHLLTSGLKAVLSWNVVAGMEESRKAMGGHGFSIYSGIGERFAKETPGQTYEGDNYVLVQQTARGLLKEFMLLKSGRKNKLMSCTQFLSKLQDTKCNGIIDWNSRDTQLNILAVRIYRSLESLAHAATSEDWSELNMACVRLTKAFVDHHVAAVFCGEISKQSNIGAAGVGTILQKLADVFILDALQTGIPDLAEFDIVPNSAIGALRKAFASSINALRLDLIGLTDAFGFTDWELNSLLGRSDGNVYQELWKTVNEKNPINTNRTDDFVVPSFERLLKPLHEIAKI